MQKKASLSWLQKEILKDKRKIKLHKGKIISEIKASGMEAVLHKPKVKKIENVSLWKKLKNLIGF